MTFSQGVWAAGAILVSAWLLPSLFPCALDPVLVYTPAAVSTAGMLLLMSTFIYYKQRNEDGFDYLKASLDMYDTEDNMALMLVCLYPIAGILLGVLNAYRFSEENSGIMAVMPAMVSVSAIVCFFTGNPQDVTSTFVPGILLSGIVAGYAWHLPFLVEFSGGPLFHIPAASSSAGLLVLLSDILFVPKRWRSYDGYINKLRRSDRFSLSFFAAVSMLSICTGIYVIIATEHVKNKWVVVISPTLLLLSEFLYFFFAKPHMKRNLFKT